MGLVVAATHLHLGQYVALKFLRPDRGDVNSQWDALARFSLEAKTVAQLRSEHVAHVLDAGVDDDGTPYMVMEYLEGQSLARSLQANGPLDLASAVEYAIQACEGLAEAHAYGIVHRDIKPYNLFLVERSPGWHAIKIVDFGISKFASSDALNVVTGVIIGSPCYMSPEQLRSTATVDHRSDIWSLGATLYELLAGRAAFDASQTLAELVTAILEKPAPDLHAARRDVPKELAAVITRCLAKDRVMRFQSAGEVAMALLPFAPARARVPAERAASMTPAFAVALPPEPGDPVRTLEPAGREFGPKQEPVRTLEPAGREFGPKQDEKPARARETATSTETQTPAEKQTSGMSLAPVIMPAERLLDMPTPTPPPLTTLADLSQADKNMEAGDELSTRRTPKWLGAAALGAVAAMLFFAILFAAPANGSKASPATKPPPQSLAAVAALTRPEGPSLPTAALAPLEPGRPDLMELAVHTSPVQPRVVADSPPSTGNTALTTNRARAAPATLPRLAKRALVVGLPQPASGPTAIQAPLASTGGEVDSAGGRIPLRPIETKDPYGIQ
jgi:serine/threonine-protein kinase